MSKTNSEMKKELEDDLRYEEILKYDKEIRNDGNITDAINPSHYKHRGIETIDYMKAISNIEEYQGHLRLTAIKYLSRLGKKDKPIQEVKKAIWYLEKLVESLKEFEEFGNEGEWYDIHS